MAETTHYTTIPADATFNESDNTVQLNGQTITIEGLTFTSKEEFEQKKAEHQSAQ